MRGDAEAPGFRHERLEVWQKATAFATQIYVETRSFPADERFGLTSQLRRAAVSIPSNIAEGSGRVSNRDFIRFLEIAYGSVLEVMTQLVIAHRQDFVSEDVLQSLRSEGQELCRMLSGLKTSLGRKL